jgi:VanZ family protein
VVGYACGLFVIVESQFDGYKLGMLQKFKSTIAWAYLAFVGFATVSPAQLRPTLTTSEPSQIVTLEHLIAFSLLGIVFSFAYPKRYFLVCFLVFGSAILLEFLQLLVPDRDARIVDAFEKLSGAAIGIFLAWVFSHYISNLKFCSYSPNSGGKNGEACGLGSSLVRDVSRRRTQRNSTGSSGAPS